MDNPTGDLENELGVILNRYSAEKESNTPDFILAKYLTRCLEAYDEAANRRDGWYGLRLRPGQSAEALLAPKKHQPDCVEPHWEDQ